VRSLLIVLAISACAPMATITTEVKIRDPSSITIASEAGALVFPPGLDDADLAGQPGPCGDATCALHIRRDRGDLSAQWVTSLPLENGGWQSLAARNASFIVDGALPNLAAGERLVMVPRCSSVTVAGPLYFVDDRCPPRGETLAAARFTLVIPRHQVDVIEHVRVQKADAYAIGAMSTSVAIVGAVIAAVTPMPSKSDVDQRDIRMALVGACIGAAAAVDLALTPTLFANDADAER
jgi:hypothetical protein